MPGWDRELEHALLDEGAYRVQTLLEDTPQLDVSRVRTLADLTQDSSLTYDMLLDSVRQATLREIRSRYARRVVVVPDAAQVPLVPGTEAEAPAGLRSVCTALAVTEDETTAGVLNQEVREVALDIEARKSQMLWWLPRLPAIVHALAPHARTIMAVDGGFQEYPMLARTDRAGAVCVVCVSRDGRLSSVAQPAFATVAKEGRRGEACLPTPGRLAAFSGARDLDVEYQWTNVRLRRPSGAPRDLPEELDASAVLVQKPDRSAHGLRWHLVSSEPCEGLEDVEQMILDYAQHWHAERFCYLLATGMEMDALGLRDRPDLQPLIYALAAQQISRLCLAAREDPDMPADFFLSDEEAHALYISTNRSLLLPHPYTVRRAVQNLSILGGMRHSMSAKPSGPRPIWKGYGKLLSLMAKEGAEG